MNKLKIDNYDGPNLFLGFVLGIGMWGISLISNIFYKVIGSVLLLIIILILFYWSNNIKYKQIKEGKRREYG